MNGQIVISGDVHHMSMRTSDQKYLTRTEGEAALEMGRLACKYRVKLTLFVTGKLVREEPSTFRKLVRLPSVEIGGHEFFARSPAWLYHGLFHRLMGLSRNGPRCYQSQEIRATVKVIEGLTGYRIRGWRNHGYEHDQHTGDILKGIGFDYWSNRVGPDLDGHVDRYDLVSLPVNTLPDHDHLAHADVTPVDGSRKLKNSRFTEPVLSPTDWLEKVLSSTREIVRNGEMATLLVHPACMDIVDRFSTFSTLIRELSSFSTLTASEAASVVRSRPES